MRLVFVGVALLLVLLSRNGHWPSHKATKTIWGNFNLLKKQRRTFKSHQCQLLTIA